MWASSRSGAGEQSPMSACCQRQEERFAHVRGESAAVLVVTRAGAVSLCSVLAAAGSRCNQSSNYHGKLQREDV